jgi:hypothetical protein
VERTEAEQRERRKKNSGEEEKTVEKASVPQIHPHLQSTNSQTRKKNGQIQGRVRHRDIERDLEQG